MKSDNFEAQKDDIRRILRKSLGVLGDGKESGETDDAMEAFFECFIIGQQIQTGLTENGENWPHDFNICDFVDAVTKVMDGTLEEMGIVLEKARPSDSGSDDSSREHLGRHLLMAASIGYFIKYGGGAVLKITIEQEND